MNNVSSAALRRRRQQLVRALPPLEQIIRGSLIETYKRCGRIKLSLQQWPWARTQALSVYSGPNRRPRTARLCAECDLSASRGFSGQLPQATGDAQRDLCAQCRTSASPGESRLNGPGGCSPRSNQGGRHHRQYDRILSGWGRPAAQHGRSRS